MRVGWSTGAGPLAPSRLRTFIHGLAPPRDIVLCDIHGQCSHPRASTRWRGFATTRHRRWPSTARRRRVPGRRLRRRGCALTPEMLRTMSGNPSSRLHASDPGNASAIPRCSRLRHHLRLHGPFSDYPNQVNNVLGFYIFSGVPRRAGHEDQRGDEARRGACAGRAGPRQTVPDTKSCTAYGVEKLEFRGTYSRSQAAGSAASCAPSPPP